MDKKKQPQKPPESKFKTPPDFLTVEDKVKTMKLSPEQMNDLYTTVIESEMLSARTKEERMAWADLKVRKKAKVSMKRMEEAFIEEFQLWLQGRSIYNVQEKTWNKFIMTNTGLQESTETKKHTPWGNKPLLHVPGVAELLEGPATNRDHVIKVLTKLKLTGPRNINEAWIYYKYIVRGVGIDGNIVNEQNIFSDYDYLNHPILEDTFPDDQDNLGGLGPDLRYDVGAADNNAPPKYNNSLYRKCLAVSRGNALAGDIDLLSTQEFNMLGPEDKMFMTIIWRSRLAGNVRRNANNALLQIDLNAAVGAVQNQANNLPPQVNQNPPAANLPPAPVPGIAEVIAELQALNQLTANVHGRIEDQTGIMAEQHMLLRNEIQQATINISNSFDGGVGDIDSTMRREFTKVVDAMNQNFTNIRTDFSPEGNSHVSLRGMAGGVLNRIGIVPPPNPPPPPPQEPPAAPPPEPPAAPPPEPPAAPPPEPPAAPPPEPPAAPPQEEPPAPPPPQPEPVAVVVDPVISPAPIVLVPGPKIGYPEARLREQHDPRFGVDILKKILKETSKGAEKNRKTPNPGSDAYKNRNYKQYVDHLVTSAFNDVSDVTIRKAVDYLKRANPNDPQVQSMEVFSAGGNVDRDIIYRENIRAWLESEENLEGGIPFAESLISETGKRAVESLRFMNSGLGMDMVELFEAKKGRQEHEKLLFMDAMKDMPQLFHNEEHLSQNDKEHRKRAVGSFRDNIINLYRMFNDSWLQQEGDNELNPRVLGDRRPSAPKFIRRTQIYKATNALAHLAMSDPRPTRRETDRTANRASNPAGVRPGTDVPYLTNLGGTELDNDLDEVHALYGGYLFSMLGTQPNEPSHMANYMGRLLDARIEKIRTDNNVPDNIDMLLRQFSVGQHMTYPNQERLYDTFTIPMPLARHNEGHLKHINLIQETYKSFKDLALQKVDGKQERFMESIRRDVGTLGRYGFTEEDMASYYTRVVDNIGPELREQVLRAANDDAFKPTAARQEIARMLPLVQNAGQYYEAPPIDRPSVNASTGIHGLEKLPPKTQALYNQIMEYMMMGSEAYHNQQEPDTSNAAEINDNIGRLQQLGLDPMKFVQEYKEHIMFQAGNSNFLELMKIGPPKNPIQWKNGDVEGIHQLPQKLQPRAGQTVSAIKKLAVDFTTGTQPSQANIEQLTENMIFLARGGYDMYDFLEQYSKDTFRDDVTISRFFEFIDLTRPETQDQIYRRLQAEEQQRQTIQAEEQRIGSTLQQNIERKRLKKQQTGNQRKISNIPYEFYEDFSKQIDNVASGNATSADIPLLEKFKRRIDKMAPTGANAEHLKDIVNGMIDHIKDTEIVNKNIPQAIEISGLREMSHVFETYSDARSIVGLAKQSQVTDEFVSAIDERMAAVARKDYLNKELKKLNIKYGEAAKNTQYRQGSAKISLQMQMIQREINSLDVSKAGLSVDPSEGIVAERMANMAYEYDTIERQTEFLRIQAMSEDPTRPLGKALSMKYDEQLKLLESKKPALAKEAEVIDERITILRGINEGLGNNVFNASFDKMIAKGTDAQQFIEKLKADIEATNANNKKIRQLENLKYNILNPDRKAGRIDTVDNKYIHHLYKQTGKRLISVSDKYMGQFTEDHLNNGIDRFHMGMLGGLNGLFLDYQTFKDADDETHEMGKTLEDLRSHYYNTIKTPRKGGYLTFDPAKVDSNSLENLKKLAQSDAVKNALEADKRNHAIQMQ